MPSPNEEIMSHDHSESPIKTPNQLIAVIVASFVIPIATILLLVNFVGNTSKLGADAMSQSPEAIAERIRPVADVSFTMPEAPEGVAAPAAAGGAVALKTGEQVYNAACAACHGAGVAGAPKKGDGGAWGARIAQGYDTLVSHAIKGIRGMPAKGGNASLDDVEVARAVVYLANGSGAKFKEPAAK
jgi:cytochrome c5